MIYLYQKRLRSVDEEETLSIGWNSNQFGNTCTHVHNELKRLKYFSQALSLE